MKRDHAIIAVADSNLPSPQSVVDASPWSHHALGRLAEGTDSAPVYLGQDKADS